MLGYPNYCVPPQVPTGTLTWPLWQPPPPPKSRSLIFTAIWAVTGRCGGARGPVAAHRNARVPLWLIDLSRRCGLLRPPFAVFGARDGGCPGGQAPCLRAPADIRNIVRDTQTIRTNLLPTKRRATRASCTNGVFHSISTRAPHGLWPVVYRGNPRSKAKSSLPFAGCGCGSPDCRRSRQ